MISVEGRRHGGADGTVTMELEVNVEVKMILFTLFRFIKGKIFLF